MFLIVKFTVLTTTAPTGLISVAIHRTNEQLVTIVVVARLNTGTKTRWSRKSNIYKPLTPNKNHRNEQTKQTVVLLSNEIIFKKRVLLHFPQVPQNPSRNFYSNWRSNREKIPQTFFSELSGIPRGAGNGSSNAPPYLCTSQNTTTYNATFLESSLSPETFTKAQITSKSEKLSAANQNRAPKNPETSGDYHTQVLSYTKTPDSSHIGLKIPSGL